MPTALSRSDGVWQRLCWLNVLITVCLLNTVGAVWTHYERKKWHIVCYIRLEPRHGALDLKSIHKFPCFPCLQQLLGRWCRFTDPLTPSVVLPLCVSHLWAHGQLAAREAPDHYSDAVYMQCKWLINKQRRTEPHVPPGRPCSLCKSVPTALSAGMRQEIKSWG